MGDLERDTAIIGSDGAFRALVSADWEVWGPNGGYVASFALRAAGAHMGRSRPASINAQFLGAAAFDQIDIAVETVRATKFATLVDVTISQGDRSILNAQIWGSDDPGGLEHTTNDTSKTTPRWTDLLPLSELATDGGPPHPFWSNVEIRPTDWVENWHERPPGEGEKHDWYRFQPTPSYDDPWADACRSLILLDIDSWPAACRAHPGDLDYFAPSIELTARFHRHAGDNDWLLNRAWAPVAHAGLIGARGEVWTDDDQLVASGGSTLLCVPSTRRPDR